MTILGNMGQSEHLLEMLGRYIKVRPFEKHPKAMMGIFFDRASERVLRKNFAKKRISKRKQVLIFKNMLEQLRNTYGKWVNLSGFKVREDLSIRFRCNLPFAFRTDFGPLFAPFGGMDLFYTGHCFERFEERVDPFIYASMKKHLAAEMKTEPTTADILMFYSNIVPREFAIKGDVHHVNVGCGILVLDRFPEFFIAKTFLSTYMNPTDNVQWVRVIGKPDRSLTLKEAFSVPTENIPGPLFDLDFSNRESFNENEEMHE